MQTQPCRSRRAADHPHYQGGVHFQFHRETTPHVTIAYGNTDNVPTADAIAAVEKLNASGLKTDATLEEAELVLLERRQRSYAWEVVSPVPLTGTP